MALTGTLTGTGTRPKRTGTLPRTRTGAIVYLNLATGFTTFTIENIERFRYVHFVDDSAGVKRKKWCRSSGCTYCATGSPRNLRMTMQVIHNGDKKTLEIGSVLANRIINEYSVGDTISIEKMGFGLRTTYNVIHIATTAGKLTGSGTSISHTVDEKKTGIQELVYDLQRTNDYDEKYDLIKSFADEY